MICTPGMEQNGVTGYSLLYKLGKAVVVIVVALQEAHGEQAKLSE
jgi:hypothetical protein